MSDASRPAVDPRSGGEVVEHFAEIGISAFTTGRTAGSYNTQSEEPVRDVTARWTALRAFLGGASTRLATATQVHGSEVVVHDGGWRGWLRGDAADGHLTIERGIALAVTIADCVPVFLAHPGGAVAMLHSGWRGTALGITAVAVRAFGDLGVPVREMLLHCGPAICGSCYEVSPDVFAQLTGRNPGRPRTVDLRAIISNQARALGIVRISSSALCTRCDNDRFYSHRAGDIGRQLGVIRTMH